MLRSRTGNRGYKVFDTFRELGPAALVTAAFIGPGTLTTCTLAGAAWGYSLLWGLFFSVLATIILQEMSSRLGIVGRKGLGEAIAVTFTSPFWRVLSIILIVVAIGIGNAAYETGNILGAVMGMESVTGLTAIKMGSLSIRIWPAVIGTIAFIMLSRGHYRSIERILITLVIIMSITFITTAIMVKPDMAGIIKGLLIPTVPNGSLLMLISIIGTTVVPYNLFLHASAAKEKWRNTGDLRKSRLDSIIAIGVGGLISSAIVITSATAFYGSEGEITGVGDLGIQLEPLLGPVAGYFMAAGIFSAGISSAVTAPLAAAYAITGVLGWKSGMKDMSFRFIWSIILFAGVLFATFGLRPVRMILMAQFANGLLLPLLAIFLLKVMNNRDILGSSINGRVSNLIGIAIIIVTFLLGMKSIGSVTGLF